MERRTALVGGGSAVAALVAGCIGGATDPDGEPEPSDRTISVSGSGEIDAEPDIAEFSVAVEGRDEDVETVRDDLADRIETVRDALIDAGLDEDDVTTERFRIRQRVSEEAREERAGSDDPAPDEDGEQVSYVGYHSLSATVRDVDEVGSFIDVAIDAGADEIGRVTFTLGDEARRELRNEALELAVAQARDEAEHLAAQVDAEVIEVTHVDAAGGRVSPYRAQADVDDAATETEIHPDDVTVSASVDVTVSIR